ncbi:MAG: PQQ-binding-like beta-propeller repeat protein [Phycisphaerales bacterium JB039]
MTDPLKLPATLPLRLRWPVRSLLALGLAAVCSCAGGPETTLRAPVPGERQDASMTVTSDEIRKLGFQRDWRGYPAIGRGQTVRFLDLWDDLVLVHGTGSNLTALEPRSGERRWSRGLANPLTRFLGNVRDGNIIYSSTEGEIFVVDADTGNFLDRLDNAQIVNTRPLRVGGMLIYGTASTASNMPGAARAEVVAFLPTAGIRSVDGVKMWGMLTDGPVDKAPILVEGLVCAATVNGEVLFIEPSTGSLVGRSRMYDGPGSDPVTGEGLVFMASRDQSVYAFSPSGGRPIWRFRTEDPLTTQPTYHAGAVYIDIPSEGLVALGAATGERIWDAPSAAHGTVIGIRDGLLIVLDGRVLIAVDPRSGDVVHQVDVPGLIIARMDQFVDGNLYVASDLGLIAKLAPAQ